MWSHLQLLELTLRDTAELEEQTASSGRLAGVDMAADDNRQMFLSFRHGFSDDSRVRICFSLYSFCRQLVGPARAGIATDLSQPAGPLSD